MYTMTIHNKRLRRRSLDVHRPLQCSSIWFLTNDTCLKSCLSAILAWVSKLMHWARVFSLCTPMSLIHLNLLWIVIHIYVSAFIKWHPPSHMGPASTIWHHVADKVRDDFQGRACQTLWFLLLRSGQIISLNNDILRQQWHFTSFQLSLHGFLQALLVGSQVPRLIHFIICSPWTHWSWDSNPTCCLSAWKLVIRPLSSFLAAGLSSLL